MLKPLPKPERVTYRAEKDPRVVIATSVKDFVNAARRPENSPPVLLNDASTKKRQNFYFQEMRRIFQIYESATNTKCRHLIITEGVANKYGDVHTEPVVNEYKKLTGLFKKMMKMHAKISCQESSPRPNGIRMRGEVFAYLNTKSHPHDYDVLNIVFSEQSELAGTGWLGENGILHCADAGQFHSIKKGFWHLTPPSNNKNRYVALVREW